ncbi:MAG: Asp23/Gls24 family envelope stress response protein [Firmicutes bacterium HGW-Firmicutes-13]|nr:MAG: Asp23/Gls24 family envelope stress response protein [Firmicutes bacterium HGW-Firmicutes-13]
MGNKIKTDFGEIIISKEVIGLLAGMAAVECYGIVGMASTKIRDGLSEILKRENLSKGVEVNTSGESLNIDLYIIVGYGIKISEIGQNVIEKVKYVVENKTGLKINNININVQGVRVV